MDGPSTFPSGSRGRSPDAQEPAPAAIASAKAIMAGESFMAFASVGARTSRLPEAGAGGQSVMLRSGPPRAA
jgi:hypothetical protein